MWSTLVFLLVAQLSWAAAEESCAASGAPLNSAFVFVKPHANTPATREMVVDKLNKAGLTILSQSEINGVEIDEKSLIDQHYFSIASKATILPADKIPVPNEKFEAFFGESYASVLKDKRASNALEACKRFECSPIELNDAWREAEKAGKVVKLGGGFYCGLLSVNGKSELYVFNAFFMSMRSKFVGEENSIQGYEVQWDPAVLSWNSFRSEVLGPTDPSKAKRGSIRRAVLDNYRKLGLSSKPDNSDNGVHASASPFEGLAEKANWLGVKLQDDPFGKALLGAGLAKKRLDQWFKDPQVKLTESSSGSLFDDLEDLDAAECLQRLIELNKLNR
mmetsp:Transcript_35942/g.86872  ORF Transcript_35942/g.86872 Transcript_35942/m.86872 type:complete len:334 (+) Transcript_35942:31-1032(+)